MSYAKMMKWNKRHKKGTRQSYFGFNASGITSGEISERERIYIAEWKGKTLEERKEIWAKYSECIALDLGSWHWKWCVFERNFVDTRTNEVF